MSNDTPQGPDAGDRREPVDEQGTIENDAVENDTVEDGTAEPVEPAAAAQDSSVGERRDDDADYAGAADAADAGGAEAVGTASGSARPAVQPEDVSDDTAAFDVVGPEHDEGDVRERHEPVILPPEPSRPVEVDTVSEPEAAASVEDEPEGREAAATQEAPVPQPVPYTATAAAATPMYVTAPTPPKRRGNRLVGILIDVVATVAYAVVFAAVALGLFALRDPRTAVDVWERYLQTAGFWVPVVVFFLAYALLIAIVNRGGWWAHVLGSFFVGVIVYFGYLGGALLTVHAWTLSLNEANQFIGTLWTNALTIASAVVAREVALWFGAWIAARGRRVRAANLEAQREYDRRVAAGPTTSPGA